MKPTDEQAAALELFLTGQSMVIDAGAGTGKTSTLQLLAASTRERGQYVAFNRAIVDDVAGRLPVRCAANTAHSLAFKAVGVRYARRLKAERARGGTVATHLGIGPFVVNYGGQRKRLAPGWSAGQVQKAIRNWCQSADPVLEARHFPYVDGIDLPTPDGKRTWTNNDRLREYLLPFAEAGWRDLVRTDTEGGGVLRFGHEHYLKLWQLSEPRLETAFILFDEAQDANPVMAAVIEAQEHAQRVYVGDANQAIYAFTGAVDAMEGFAPELRRSLTQSFRFGPLIAARANRFLAALASPLRLRGLEAIPSTVGELADEYDADVVLCRTNAKALDTVLNAQGDGQRVHLVGGGTEVASFARAAQRLMDGRPAEHHELACFDSWEDVQDYVQHDPQGDELALMVKLIDDFGPELILDAVDGTHREGEGVLTVSTAHKAKGRQWGIVRLADDFAGRDASQDELRLLYVAVTRAQLHVDDSVLHKERAGAPAPAPVPLPAAALELLAAET